MKLKPELIPAEICNLYTDRKKQSVVNMSHEIPMLAGNESFWSYHESHDPKLFLKPADVLSWIPTHRHHGDAN